MIAETRHAAKMLATVVAVLLIIHGGDLHAQSDDEDIDTPGLTVDALAGWKGMTSATAPVPVSFLFSNFTNGPIDAELVLVDDWGGNRADLGEIYLTAGQTRRFGTVRSMRRWNRCIAELRSGNKVLWRRQLLLNNGINYNRVSNHVLIVNDSQRMLEFAGGLSPDAETPQDPVIINAGGVNPATPPLVSMNVMTWQIPTHPGPLNPVTALVFPGPVDAERLNAGQWAAIAEFVCQGGTVLLPENETQLFEAISAASPLPILPASIENEFPTRRCGLGSIRLFSKPLFMEDNDSEEERVATLIASLEQEQLHRQVGLSSHYQRDSGRAERSRITILTFMIIYTLMSGIVTLAFVRRKNRTVLVYVCSLVGVACATSAILGGGVRYSQGDVSWVSLTRLTEKGALQYAELEVQSAGGRSDRLSILGLNPDMQVLATERQLYYGNNYYDRDPYPSFTVQPDMAADRPEGFESRVSITPWGRRNLMAIDYLPDLKAMDVSLSFKRAPGSPSDAPPKGEFTISVTNNSGVDFYDCRLCIAVGANEGTIEQVQQARESRLRRFGYWEQTEIIPTKYGSIILGEIKRGTTKEARFEALFDSMQWSIQTEDASFAPAPATNPGGVRICLVSSIAVSPSLRIDDANSNFGTVCEKHFICQELTPSQIPEEFRGIAGDMLKIDIENDF